MRKGGEWTRRRDKKGGKGVWYEDEEDIKRRDKGEDEKGCDYERDEFGWNGGEQKR